MLNTPCFSVCVREHACLVPCDPDSVCVQFQAGEAAAESDRGAMPERERNQPGRPDSSQQSGSRHW